MTKLKIFFIFITVGLFYFLSQVFSGRIILPQTISLGFITIRYYGIFIALAVATGFYLALNKSEEYVLSKKQAEDILFYTIVGGFIGARLYHVVSSWQYYLQYPLDILKVWNGGLSIYGVVLGGSITLILFAKSYKLKAISLLNWLTPSLILGQIIGRFGNFFNYELYGYPTNLAWKMFVPSSFRNAEYLSSSYFHPLFLYEQIGLLVIFLIIRKFENQKKSGLFFRYLLLYNILRFVLEFLRIDSVFWGNIRVNAIMSVVLSLVSAAVIYATSSNKRPVDS